MSPAAIVKPSVRIFISYSSRDSELAETLKRTIEGGGVSCFYAPTDIEARENWRDHLEEEIGRTDLVVLLYTEAAAHSDEVYKEIALAHSKGQKIWLLMDKDTALADRFKPFELGSRYQAFVLGFVTDAAVFENLRRKIDQKFGRVDGPAAGRIDPAKNPYQRTSYTAGDRDYFFGRDAECNQLSYAIYDGAERVFFVYGASGAGKSSLIDAGLRPLLEKEWWFSKPVSPKTDSPETMPGFLWRQIERQLNAESSKAGGSDDDVPRDIIHAVNQLGRTGYVFWFDHMERLLATSGDHQARFFRTAREILQNTGRIRIIISFRREVLAQAEDRANQLPVGCWRKWLLRNLSSQGARESIVEPAEKRNGVRVEGDLADELVKTLAREEGEDRDGTKIVTVNPVNLQLVCGRLWNAGRPGLSSISLSDVLERYPSVAEFVRSALTDHLEEAINRIASRGTNAKQRRELILMGLLQFVSEDRRRQQLKEETISAALNGGDRHSKRVGRLYGDVVDELRDERLLQRTDIGFATPDFRYELVHDSLAEAIDRFRAELTLLRTLNALESLLHSALDEHHKLTGKFNRNASLLSDLEGSRREETAFFQDEKEFLFRCALGDQRHSVRKDDKETIQLEGWARLLAATDPDRFACVLKEALTPALCQDVSVRRDAIALLLLPEFRGRLKPEDLKELGGMVVDAALSPPEEIQRDASVAVCQVCEPAGARSLFDLLSDASRDRRANARHAIAWARHAADCRDSRVDASAWNAFETGWRNVAFNNRIWILIYLWVQRAIGSLGWMAFVAVMAPVFTAVFAAIAFLPMGFLGASLTLGDKASGAFKGGFHGVAGGASWGLGISIALLLYWVILRGGRVSGDWREWIKAALAACAGGFAAGVVLTFMLGFVFQDESLYHAGWLCSDSGLSFAIKLREMFFDTRHGWITPVFGVAVAAGISWNLQRVTADPRTEAYFHQEPGAIQRPRQAFAAIGRVVRVVMRRWWCQVIAVSLGGLAVFRLLQPGPGICDMSPPTLTACVLDLRKAPPPQPCDYSKHPPLAPKWARVAGMVFIISVGGIFLESGLLFGILAARRGVKLERDEHFLETLNT